MSWTKRQLVETAFEEIGMAAYVFDLQPEQVESARRSMDAMAALWSSKNIQIGYPLPTEADSSDLDQDSYIPDYAIETFYLNLAKRLASKFGKVLAPEKVVLAKEGYENLLRMAVSHPPQMKYACSLPSGAGNKQCDPFIVNTQDNVVLAPNQDAEFFNE
ncbi:packaged DNA stabilization gp4 family protein [Acinetobacter sp. AOR41_HL]|uniref:packaged DNA stabilization gp4 family protein n=1 Tax=Acinetobacter sp. AOR41_HL TaxID=2919388 RepID=UPI0022EBA3CF|nr:packaged DNA stabilization gp4 family protein [Acinetobacter sp. AOR41_HL]MDA3463490.1 packaged DNA stabilization gp4 family protein [Acinetobacter sp. AOR41_HL]